MKRDRIDRRRPERTFASFLASLLLHALAAYFLFSLATSSSEQAAPESFTSGAIVSVTRETPQQPVPVQVATAQPPVPHATVQPQPTAAAQPQAAPPHPRILHELSKQAPTAPPNPTPAPVSTMQPVPAVTQAPQISATAAPLVAVVPTSVPASVTSVSVKVPPTAAPIPKPTAAPTVAPTLAPPKPTAAPTVRPTIAPPKPTAAPTAAPSATPAPEPSALQATAAPIVAMTKPQVVVTPGAQSEVHVVQSEQKGTAPTPGPKTVGSPGPKPVAPVKAPVSVVPRPIQPLPATPPPHAAAPVSKTASSLLQRLRNLIPTSAPSVQPAQPKHYSNIGNLKLVPPEPTPPPEVLAVTKYLYVENVAAQHWGKIIGSAPEERYVKMYVTKVKRIGFINWCTGWVVRAPIAGTSQWEVEPNSSFICSGHLEPFAPDALPSASPSP